MSPAIASLAVGIGFGVLGAGTLGAVAALQRARAALPMFLFVSGVGSVITAYALFAAAA